MVTISFTTPNPQLSARLANAHAREFISWGIEINAHESEDAEHFLEGKLTQIKEQLEASEAAVNRYRRDKGIVPGLISVNGKEDVVLDRLNKLSSDLQEAHLQTIALGTQVSMIREGRQDALPAVIENGLVQKLKETPGQRRGRIRNRCRASSNPTTRRCSSWSAKSRARRTF